MPRAHGSKSIKDFERRMQALELRKAGATYDQIAKTCGYTDRTYAYKAVQTCIKNLIRERSSEVVTIEIERLDAMLLSIWSKVKDGDVAAIDRAIKIMERRAKLLGLDAPIKNEVSGPDGKPIQTQVFNHESVIAALEARSIGDSEESGSNENGSDGEEMG